MKEEIPEIFWELVKARFERMPPNLRLVIGGVGSLKKEEILNHIEKKDEIGELLGRMEIEYLKLIKEEVESYEEALNNIARP
ncbi:MAG: hypothetical protein LM587_00720 [Candidatus Aenigmarchaeota archaeon]|nr:hypothetical protein [Candidatus Aenigmarchaeota archaeon]